MAKIGTPTLDKPGRSHWVEIAYDGGGNGLQPQKETFYPYADIDVAGEPRRVEFEAIRYYDRHNSDPNYIGWRPWNFYLRAVKPQRGIGDKTERAIRDACEPVIREWIDSPGYAESAQRTWFYTIAREIRDIRTSNDYKAREALDRYGDKVSPEQRDRLEQALEAQLLALRLLDSAAENAEGS